jgi:hypothetical protein
VKAYDAFLDAGGYDAYEAYDLTDPKHPTFYERFADRADVERKAAKENPPDEFADHEALD